MDPRRNRALACAATVLALACTPLTGAVATATPDAPAVTATPADARLVDLAVYSPAMQRSIAVKVLRPADTTRPAPTLYLLNGAGGGEDAANWFGQTDAVDFFADKHVNVVIPMEGAFSYYTDWERADEGLAETLGNNGRNMWTTFLTEELPPVIDATFGATGANALAGISMAGSSVLDLTIQAPTRYRSVAAYSGCAMTSDPLGRMFVTVVISLGGGDPENMWGPTGGDGWREHDPYLQAHRLPPIPMYISSGSGLPGPHDTLANPRLHNDDRQLLNQTLVGGAIESVTNLCTTRLAQRTAELGRTDITYNIRRPGTHSWGYWQDDLRDSWPMIARSIGAE
ncbi:alpha/beta hydrolase [Nocardia farcinica]|uniref:Mycolyl transferase 85A n=1 Tax=Nocardia farcinica TaxID=37329 RepID=A0A0H5NKZ1_NOCFR|nr:alpha/beta hydrolase family protein [Nocardia farcinica]AXK85085.1 esterase family protein [Nocardia farcinica]MBF6255706.1 esterase family protein [Nocardia farcinica]MBF6520107.1 esterase family protein [Nocardia farcinica]PFX05002.1 Diacylglycerol acyltransferase/mycolyltransferase Ag85B [Nocardia farcinica]PFX09407.1 Diacylglycerol acyltransferase/mycolyltransferase Ag85B [Nocardia farcinica]